MVAVIAVFSMAVELVYADRWVRLITKSGPTSLDSVLKSLRLQVDELFYMPCQLSV